MSLAQRNAGASGCDRSGRLSHSVDGAAAIQPQGCPVDGRVDRVVSRHVGGWPRRHACPRRVPGAGTALDHRLLHPAAVGDEFGRLCGDANEAAAAAPWPQRRALRRSVRLALRADLDTAGRAHLHRVHHAVLGCVACGGIPRRKAEPAKDLGDPARARRGDRHRAAGTWIRSIPDTSSCSPARSPSVFR